MQSLFLLLLLTFSFGCSSTTSSLGTFAVNMKYPPQSFDPRQTRLFADQTLIRHMYEGLLQENSQTGDIELALAKDYTISEDKTTYTFHLKNVFWSNGDPITSQDFVESWEQVIRKNIVSIQSHTFYPIKNAKDILEDKCSTQSLGIESPDPQTLIVSLETPCAHFLRLLTLPVFYPVHKTLRENPSSKKLQITSGAFYPSDQQNQQWLCLSKNPFYHEKHRVHLKKILIYFVADPHTAALLFQQKKLHWLGPPWGEPIPIEISSFLDSQGKLLSIAGNTTTRLIFNIERSPWSHPKLRKALALSIDKEALVHIVFQDLAEPTDHILHQKFYPKPYPKRHSQAKRSIEAKKLFEEALQELQISRKDLENEEIAFSTLSFSYEKIAQLLREQWKETLGITLPLAGKEFSVLQQTLQSKQYSLVISQWLANFIDPMATFSAFLYPQGTIPYSLNDSHFQALLTALSQEHIPSKRDTLIIESLDYLERKHILEPLCIPNLRFSLNKKLKNLNLHGRRVADLRFVEDLG
ncbi:peptide ABC transporter substrate-binding protein [Chlamydia sp. 17-3921]|uniref:peptide ABC transporter substrate-binding protein n=1 Tax=Chlamydia sp. 17-3921 TaxID=2675798 RepID=UPI001F288EA8|nr:peptide ABC transporter substrate-binding protein [Chlamydia sp. 17-3921]